MKELKTRNQLPELLNELGLNGVGIEIGTQTGLFSEVILKKSKLVMFWSVDCWEHQKEYNDIANHGNLRQRYYHLKTILRLWKFKGRSGIIKGYSEDIAKEKDWLENLDFIYIDAEHTYEGCKKNLEIWYSRVKEGGIISGHDYFNGDIPTCKECGVKRAVDEFMKKKGEKVNSTTSGFPRSWYVIKTKQNL